MNAYTKTYIVVAVLSAVALGILGSGLWTSRRTAKLESAIEAAKQNADQNELRAKAKEIEAAQYKQKIEYLEQQLAEIRELANKQDEELEKLNVHSRGARADVERTRRTRTRPTTADQLCQKLAEVGHPCD